MQTVRQEEYIKANRLERTASTWPYRRPAAPLAFIFNIQVNMLNAGYFLYESGAFLLNGISVIICCINIETTEIT